MMMMIDTNDDDGSNDDDRNISYSGRGDGGGCSSGGEGVAISMREVGRMTVAVMVVGILLMVI